MLTMKDIIREGHPTLSKRSSKVELPLSETDKQLLKDMMTYLEISQDPEKNETHQLRPGVGLSAPQINVSKQLFCILTTDEKNEKLYKLMLANPRIISHSVKQTYIPGGEGCLSVDREVTGVVPRHKKVKIRAHQYLPEKDKTRQIELRISGYVGVVLQHEIDHLKGILFVDKLKEILPDATPVEFIQEAEETSKEE
ncbi:MAG: peptide deformylase [Candidatus Izimaplasma sp.]|nr:peptide deformylase [Candidatus Izimaplasma bacterium]